MRRHLALAAMVVGLWGGHAAAEDKVITLVADTWCPYNCDPEDENPGYFVELAKKVFEPLGYKIDYSIIPWTRAVEETKAGKYNVLIASDPANTPEFIFAKQETAIFCGSSLFIQKGQGFEYKGLESLKDKRLGTIADYDYDPEIDPYIEENKHKHNHVQVLYGDDALDRNILKLLAGRIDVLVENPYVFANELKEIDKTLDDFERVADVGDYNNHLCYLSFSPQKLESQKLAKLLDEGVARLNETGEIEKLKAKYGIE